VSTESALTQLSDSSAAAVRGVLEVFVGDEVSVGDVTVMADGQSPFVGLPVPAIAVSVSYAGGVGGGNVFVISKLGARRLAARMMTDEPPDTAEDDLSELELSAVADASNQMMAATAVATGNVLGQEVGISAPETKLITEEREAEAAYGQAGHTASVAFTVCGEPALLIQLIPTNFVARLSRSVDEPASEVDELSEDANGYSVDGDSMLGVPVRLWAELGRFRMELGRAISLAPGAVVELEEAVDAPVELFVNGALFGHGELLVADDGTWAVRIGDLVTAADVVTDNGGLT
jgi:flagellar motor switch protein FliN